MKRSTLTLNQQAILEALLARHGLVVTSEQIAELLAHTHAQSKRRFMAALVEAGWLVRIRKGLYQIAELGALGTLSLSRLTIAQLLAPDSYISFQAALQHHGLFDQGLATVGSVARRRHAPVHLQGATYSYVATQEQFYFGFDDTPLDGRRVHVASAAKAMLDLLQFKRTQAHVDLVLEILRENGPTQDLDRLVEYARRLPRAVQQTAGYLLEVTGHSEVAARLQPTDGASVAWLTPESSVYSHRWRLYTDPYFEQWTPKP